MWRLKVTDLVTDAGRRKGLDEMLLWAENHPEVIKEEDDAAKKLKDSNRKVIVVEAKIDKEMYESDPDDDDAQNVQGGGGGGGGDKDEEKGKEKEQKKSDANDIDNPFLRPVKFPRTPGMLKRKL